MKKKLNLLLSFMAVIVLSTGCKKNKELQPGTDSTNEQHAVLGKARGATQISGVGFYAATGECTSPLGEGASYAVRMTGDIEGCLYTFIDDFECSPSGTYREAGREFFVGTYKGQTGTFWTTYKFEAKYEGCAGGSPLGSEIFGRCQHPITEGSGNGVFEGVSGRLDFQDDIEAGNFPYRGHLQF